MDFQFNDQIEREFLLLGFDNPKEILLTGHPLFSFFYASAVLPIKNTWILGYDRVEFGFVLAEPDKSCSSYLRMITASNDNHKPRRDEEDRVVFRFTHLSGPFPTKQAMTRMIELEERCRIRHAAAVFAELTLARNERIRGPSKDGANLRPF
jgi:hypothetical protein